MSQLHPIYSSKRISHIHIYFFLRSTCRSSNKTSTQKFSFYLLLLLILLNLFIISVRDEFFIVANSSAAGPSGRTVRGRSAATRLLRLWFRIPLGAWMSVCCECCVLSARGLCDELIAHPEESYRPWCVVCDLETS